MNHFKYCLKISCVIFFGMFLCTSQYASIDWHLPAQQISLNSQGALATLPVIATDGLTTVIAFWIQNLNKSIYAASFDLSSKTWGPPTLVYTSNLSTINEIQAVSAGPNKAIVVWGENDSNLYGALFTSNIPMPSAVLLAVNYGTLEYLAAVQYESGKALIAYIDKTTNYDVFAVFFQPGSLVVNQVKLSTNTPPATAGGLPARISPFIAIQPGTNIAFIVWAQNTTGFGPQVIGVPFYYPFNVAPNNYTRFQIQAMRQDFNAPKIAFNPADNNPIVIFGANPGGSDPQIVGTVWTNPTATNTIPASAMNRISSQILYDLSFTNRLRLNVAVDGPNLFKVVYAQNNSIGNNNVYSAMYVPGNSLPINYQINSPSTSSNNVLCVPQVKSLGFANKNAIVWEQNNKILGTTFLPGAPFNAIQLSSNVAGSALNRINLALADNLAIVVWAQGTNSTTSTQIFATYGILPPVFTNVQVSKELHRFIACCDLVNVITWSAVPNAIAYRIYLSTNLNQPLATIQAGQPLIFRHYCRKSNVQETYYVYAVDSFGNQSMPIIVTPPLLSNCSF